ncbi:uncharacterized protein LOC108625014 isoform X2 [Ceratina calcarata]|uniref:Uncharacterized protein LOC108625014 isoform X2 n=1 Tax=Ceratina calcarata TaxID=156304 RepID=A0AAJ7IZ82_9HYME|nr:uncharacterized protein LOC108625014 isoform X2 [Ceratina calcarata]
MTPNLRRGVSRNREDSIVSKNCPLKKSMNLISQGNNMEVVDRLLCKPVSVNIVKLLKAEKKTPLKPRNRSRITKRKRPKHSTKKSSTKQTPNKLDSLLKEENQPYIKLHRIDEVFYKIAQSLARASANGERKRIQEKPVDGTTEAEQKKIHQEECETLISTTETDQDRIHQEEALDVSIETNQKRIHQESLGTLVETQSIDEPTDKRFEDENLNTDELNEKPEAENVENHSDSDENDIVCSFKKRNKDSDDNDTSLGRSRPKRMRINSDTSEEMNSETDKSTATCALNESLNASKDLSISENLNASSETFIINGESRVNEESQSNRDTSMCLEEDDSRDTVLMGIKDNDELNVDFGNKYSAREVEEVIKEYTNVNSLSRPLITEIDVVKHDIPMDMTTTVPVAFPRVSSFSNDEQLNSAARVCRTSDEKSMINSQSPNSSYRTPPKSIRNAVQETSHTEVQKAVRDLTTEFQKEEEPKQRSSDHHSSFTADVPSLPSGVSSPEKVKETTLKRVKEKTEAIATPDPRIDEQEASLSKSQTCRLQPVPANPSTNSDSNLPITSIKKKPTDEKDSKPYRCIVCDTTYSDFATLQKHLAVHSNKNNTTTADPPNVDCLDIPEERPLVIELPERGEISESKDSSESALVNSKKSKSNTKQQTKSLPKKERSRKKTDSENKRKREKVSVQTNETCGVCSQVFLNRVDLAAHIFLHTETELQDALKRAEGKLKDTKRKDKKDKKNRRSSSSSKPSTSETIPQKEEELNKTAGKSDEIKSTEHCKSVQNKISSPKTDHQGLETRKEDLESLNQGDIHTAETPKKSGQSEANSVEKEVQQSSKKSDVTPIKISNTVEQTPSKEPETSRKKLTICECHNKYNPNITDLEIEIVLLCHICRRLFRTMKCFNKHFRHHQYTACSPTKSNQSPRLLCSTCGKVFSCVQNVQHHLEMHARSSKTTCTTNFRCNICKVMFFGIGSLFYTHWSSHMRNPYWVADEQSFPDESIVRLPSFKNLLVDGYITVAEYLCPKCKDVFATDRELNKHLENCNKVINTSIEILCDLCDVSYSEKSEFYKHVRNKHHFCGEPQLTDNGSTIVCEICKETLTNLSEFDNHWLKHLATHTTFTCAQCKAEFKDNLNLFAEHAKVHKIENVLCTVHYTNMNHICEICCIGFDSLEKFEEHMTGHSDIPIDENDPPMSCINISSGEDSPDLEACSSSCNVVQKDSTQEKSLKNRTEINEDKEDQIEETKLIIDLTKEDEAIEKQQKASGPSLQEPPQNVEESESNSMERQESQPKPRQGFLRVKTLQELTGTAYICKTCGCSFESVSELSNHEKHHESANDQGNVQLNNLIGIVAKDILQDSSQNEFKLQLLVKQSGVCKEIPLRTEHLQRHSPVIQNSQPGDQTVADSAINLSTQNNNTEQQASSSNSPVGFHKNLPYNNIVRKSKAVPRTAVLKTDGTMYKFRMMPSSLPPDERKRLMASFGFIIDPNDNQTKFKCKFCDFCSVNESDCVKHDNPGTEASCKVRYPQNRTQTQPERGNIPPSYNKPPQPSQSQGQNASYVNTYASGRGTSEMMKQNYQQIPNQPPDAVYYKTVGNTNGGMSIVINPPAATSMQNMSTFGIVHSAPQQQLFQQQVHPNPMTIIRTPYVQQSQNVVICSNNVCQVRRDQIPNGEAVITYEVRLRPTRFVCTHCSKSFGSESLLQAHVNSDHNFICTVCNERFYHYNELLVHQVKHLNTK